MTTTKAPGPRERLLASARKLTGAKGVGVGIDAILEDASVARRSLYQHFTGKDDLIAQSLLDSADKDVARYRIALERGGNDPRQRVLALFDQLDRTTSSSEYRACRYISAEVGLADPDHPAHEATRAFTARLRGLFETELTNLGHADPAASADQILVLVEGILVVAAIAPESHPAVAVRPLVELILDARAKDPSPTRTA